MKKKVMTVIAILIWGVAIVAVAFGLDNYISRNKALDMIDYDLETMEEAEIAGDMDLIEQLSDSYYSDFDYMEGKETMMIFGFGSALVLFIIGGVVFWKRR